MQGAVLVTLKKGEDLPAADPNGYSDPYVKFKLNNKTQKSSIKRFTINPAWNEKFEWFKVQLNISVCSPVLTSGVGVLLAVCDSISVAGACDRDFGVQGL